MNLVALNGVLRVGLELLRLISILMSFLRLNYAHDAVRISVNNLDSITRHQNVSFRQSVSVLCTSYRERQVEHRLINSRASNVSSSTMTLNCLNDNREQSIARIIAAINRRSCRLTLYLKVLRSNRNINGSRARDNAIIGRSTDHGVNANIVRRPRRANVVNNRQALHRDLSNGSNRSSVINEATESGLYNGVLHHLRAI